MLVVAQIWRGRGVGVPIWVLQYPVGRGDDVGEGGIAAVADWGRSVFFSFAWPSYA